MKKSGSRNSQSPQLIDARIKELGDWRGTVLSRLRTLVKEADTEVVEEWKWRGVPVWAHDRIICTGETYKNVVKMTFAKGTALKDRSGLFNTSLGGNARRAIDFHDGEKIDEEALKTLVRTAVTHPDENAGVDRLELLRRLVQQQCNAEPDQQLQHDGDKRQFDLDPDRSREFRGGERLLIVLPRYSHAETYARSTRRLTPGPSRVNCRSSH